MKKLRKIGVVVILFALVAFTVQSCNCGNGKCKPRNEISINK